MAKGEVSTAELLLMRNQHQCFVIVVVVVGVVVKFMSSDKDHGPNYELTRQRSRPKCNAYLNKHFSIIANWSHASVSYSVSALDQNGECFYWVFTGKCRHYLLSPEKETIL